MNPVWFNILWKTGAYAVAGMFTVGMNAGMVGIWIYEKKTGKDVPFLLEVPIIALTGLGTAAGTASIDEAITRVWQRYGYRTTVRVLRGPKVATRALARGTVRLVASGASKVVPFLGWSFVAYSAVQLGMFVHSRTHQRLIESRGYGIHGSSESIDLDRPSTWM